MSDLFLPTPPSILHLHRCGACGAMWRRRSGTAKALAYNAHDCHRCGETDWEDVVIEHRATARRAGPSNMWPRPGIVT